jgi:hypothetical protein
VHRQGVPLATLSEFSGERSRRLAAFSITTAEEFVSVTNSAETRQRIATLLAVDDAALGALRRAALAALPESVREEMTRPADTSEFGLGALPPKPDQGE